MGNKGNKNTCLPLSEDFNEMCPPNVAELGTVMGCDCVGQVNALNGSGAWLGQSVGAGLVGGQRMCTEAAVAGSVY